MMMITSCRLGKFPLLMLLATTFLAFAEAKLSHTKKTKQIDESNRAEWMGDESYAAGNEQGRANNDSTSSILGLDPMGSPLNCSEEPIFELSCDYGTDFACPFPNVKVPFLASPTCCERTGSDSWVQGQTCAVRGGYHVLGRKQYWQEYEFEYDQTAPFADADWCCPKNSLAPIINEFCHGPVIYEDECGTLLDVPLVPVRLELVAPDQKGYDYDYSFLYNIPCLGQNLFVCCPPDEILNQVQENACTEGRGRNGSNVHSTSGSDGGSGRNGGRNMNGNNHNGHGRKLLLETVREKESH